MAKTNKQRFDLNKSAQHEFDISKGSKIKFDLSKETDEEVVQQTPITETKSASGEKGGSNPNNTVDKGGNTGNELPKKKMLIFIILAVLIALLLWLFIPSENKSKDETNNAPVENTAGQKESSPENEVSNNQDPVEQPSNVTSEENVPPSLSTTDEPVEEIQDDAKQENETISNAIPNISHDIEAEALKVIQGNYGNGEVRKANLGSEYAVIQNKVNEMYRKGLVY